jgi:tetratricopeptide (TPR) repeat protein
MKPTLAIVGLILLLSGPASATDQWDKNKGDCDKVLKSHTTVVLARLKRCVGMWVAYADPNLVKAAAKQPLKDAFQSLYDRSMKKGDEEAEYLATSAAERINVRLKLRIRHEKVTNKRKAEGKSGDKSGPSDQPHSASKRKKFVPADVSDKDKKKANNHVKKGVKWFKKKKRDKAMKSYQKALALDGGNLDALYNYAAELAVRKKKEEAVDNLQKLQDIGTRSATKRLQAARQDTDFDSLHDYTPFKRVTGYAAIKVVNSIAEYGEDEVDRIVKTLTKLKHRVQDVGTDKKKGRTRPVIWFKDHSAPTAYLVKKVVVHPGTLMTRITWKTNYDIIVTWGNRLVKKDGIKEPAKEYEFEDPEKTMTDLSREEDKILREPEKAARQVDDAVDKPGRVIKQGEGTVDRAEKTIDTMQKTGDKLKGIFK